MRLRYDREEKQSKKKINEMREIRQKKTNLIENEIMCLWVNNQLKRMLVILMLY